MNRHMQIDRTLFTYRFVAMRELLTSLGCHAQALNNQLVIRRSYQT